jgi:hypothetical protein
MEDLGAIFSLNNWPGHLSYVLIAISYWFKKGPPGRWRQLRRPNGFTRTLACRQGLTDRKGHHTQCNLRSTGLFFVRQISYPPNAKVWGTDWQH